MKTARRHELKTNELADWLGEQIETLRPYATALLASVLAVAVVAGAYLYLSRRAAQKQELGWDRYFSALESRDPDQLRDVADEFPGTTPGLWSRLSLAEFQLATGIEKLFSDRAAANQELQNAVDNYLDVRKEAPPESMLAERATLGLGQAYESKNELDNARKEYESLRSNWSQGVYAAHATRRLADLARPSTKSFYDWFAREEPKRPLGDEPGSPGTRPDTDLDGLPDEGSLFESFIKPDDDEGVAEPAPKKPAGDTKPAEDPAAGKAGSTAPSTPADEAPAGTDPGPEPEPPAPSQANEEEGRPPGQSP